MEIEHPNLLLPPLFDFEELHFDNEDANTASSLSSVSSLLSPVDTKTNSIEKQQSESEPDQASLNAFLYQLFNATLPLPVEMEEKKEKEEENGNVLPVHNKEVDADAKRSTSEYSCPKKNAHKLPPPQLPQQQGQSQLQLQLQTQLEASKASFQSLMLDASATATTSELQSHDACNAYDQQLIYLVRCRTYYIQCHALTFNMEKQIELHSHVRIDLGYHRKTHRGYEIGQIAWIGVKKETQLFHRYYNFAAFNKDMFPTVVYAMIVDIATCQDLYQISKHLNDELMYETHCQQVLQRHGCPNVKLQITIQHDESRVYVFIQKNQYMIPLKTLFHNIFPTHFNIWVNMVRQLHDTYEFDMDHRPIPMYIVAFRTHYARCTTRHRVFDYVKVQIDENNYDIGTIVQEGHQWNIPWHLYPHSSLNEEIKEIVPGPHYNEIVKLKNNQKIEKQCEKKCKQVFPTVSLQINLQADHKRCYVFIQKEPDQPEKPADTTSTLIDSIKNYIQQQLSHIQTLNTVEMVCEMVNQLKTF